MIAGALNMKQRRRHLRLAVACCLVWAMAAGASSSSSLAASPPADDSTTTARAVIQKVLGDVLAILRDTSLAKPDKGQKVRQIAYDQMDFQTLSRLTMGRHWREISDAQQKDFIKEFRQHMSATYGHAIDHYTDEDINITADRREANGDWTVQTRIVTKKDGGGNQEQARVDYRLRQTDNRWKVIDVTIDGVSMVANFRAQFQDIMANGGIDRLLKVLREKNATPEK
jgi:phospholipid transport system substrate-binding protein